MKLRNEEKGMSLVEVVVSITILSIILLSFASLFQQSSKTTENNKEKLVAINLARGVKEQVEINPSDFIFFPEEEEINSNGLPYPVSYFQNECLLLNECKDSFKTLEPRTLNNEEYEIEVFTELPDPSNSSDNEELQMRLVTVYIIVTKKDSNIIAEAETYVYDPISRKF